jgi:predicted negative regulator of RcsB-dependent stress response
MQRLLPPLACLLCLLLGLSVGWYFGYSRPSVQNQRKILNEYQTVRDALGLTDKQMAEIGEQLPRMRKEMAREDEFAAAMALGALVPLEQGEIEKAKTRLQKTISIYYRGHKHDGNTNVLRRITNFATTNAGLSNAIYRRLE